MKKLILTLSISLISLSTMACKSLVGSYGECVSQFGSMGNESIIIKVSGNPGSEEITTNVDGQIGVMPEGDSIYMGMPTNLKCNEDGAKIVQNVGPNASDIVEVTMTTNEEESLVYEYNSPQNPVVFTCLKK